MTHEFELLTVRQIAEQRDLSPSYVGVLASRADWPKPCHIVGRSRLYDPKAIAEFFDGRDVRIAIKRKFRLG